MYKNHKVQYRAILKNRTVQYREKNNKCKNIIKLLKIDNN